MVSAVFHSPLEATTAQVTQVAPSVAARPAAPKPTPAPAPEPRLRAPIDLRAFWMRVLPHWRASACCC